MSRVLSATSRRRFPVSNNARSTRIDVSSDGKSRGLSEGLARRRARRAAHDAGKIVADLAAAVALGVDCLADVAVLREQSGLAGPVASDPVVSRLVKTLAADLPRALKAIRAARASAQGAGVGAGRGDVTTSYAYALI